MRRLWKLKTSHKVVLIGLLPSLLLLTLLIALIGGGSSSSDRLRREASGLIAARDVLRAIQLTQRVMQRAADPPASSTGALADSVTASFARVASSVDALADDTLTARAQSLRNEWGARGTATAAEEAAFRRARFSAEQLGLLEGIAASSGLNVHRGIAGHYLVVASLQQLPAMTESMTQLRSDVAVLLDARRTSESDRVRVATLAGAVDGSLRSAKRSLDLALRSDPARRTALEAKVVTADSAVTDALRLVDRTFVRAPSLTSSSAMYVAAVTSDIDAQFALMDASLESVQRELTLAVAKSERSLFIVEAILGVLFVLAVVAMAALVRSDRVRTESEMRFQSILDAAPDGIVIADDHGVIKLVNRAAERTFGFTQQSATGTLLSSHAAPDARDSIEADLRELHADTGDDASQSRQFMAIKADGTRFPIEVTRSLFQTSRGRWTISVVRDVTARRSLEQQLQQSQKMEAIGQLTGGVAHDFNNLLGVILGNLDLLETSVRDAPAALKRLGTAQKAALRAADLTKRLLAFSRKQHLEPAAIRVEDSIANLVEMASRTVGPDIAIVTDIAARVPMIFADPGGLENVLLNLVVNARDAMREGGKIAIAAGAAELDERHPAVRCGDVAAGRYVSIRVSDTGQGIPRDKLERVFEPFYTTKEQGKGTGLGLSMVYGFVKQTGGNVKIYSEVGVGTTISLILPIAVGTEMAATGSHAITHEARQGATVLVVDDEPDLLDIASAYLEEMGYRVLQANDGNAALRTLETEERVDLLMTDVLMPGMNGVKLTQHVRAARPDVRVVFTSGFPAQALAERSGTAVDGPLLNKPFLKREFAAVVNRVMEGELV